MRVVVFGGRDYRDRRRLYAVLDGIHKSNHSHNILLCLD